MTSLTIHDVVNIDMEDLERTNLVFKQKHGPNSTIRGTLGTYVSHRDLLVVTSKSVLLHATQQGN